jgi:two-component system, NtrC family, nitrogen regulation sensor histidine kinase NtrY
MMKVAIETRLAGISLLAGAPAIVVALILLWTRDFTSTTRGTLTALIVLFWFGFSWSLRERSARPLQTLANVISALREEDFSIRAAGARNPDSLGEVAREINALSSTLREQRLAALEAMALLRTVMEEIEVAIFAFDDHNCLRLVNRAGERLLAQPAKELLEQTAEHLGLADCLAQEPSRTVETDFPGAHGRWGLRRTTFRQRGLPHQLVVLSDLSRPLREEEKQAWQRLIRVLGHELNNSLAPIKSIAESLKRDLRRDARPMDWEDDLSRGLNIISSRAEALTRFLNAYSQLARLPAPQLCCVDVATLVQRVAALETRLEVEVKPGPHMVVNADPDQIEQLLINLVRNAADASLETHGCVVIGWSRYSGSQVEIFVEDEGFGLADTSNLFVPFFTTKPEGTGIGLVLSLQIAEGHRGTLTLENRKNERGARAGLRLPL